MKDIRDYARIGLVHHLLYPRCTADPEYHVRTLEEIVRRDDIETLDCCVPFGQERRDRAIDVLRNCGKEICYALHLLPLRKISLGSTNPHEQWLMRLGVKDQIEMAAAVGATGFVFPSGAGVPKSEEPEARKAFADFCRWFCGELKPHNIVAMLEPFDTTIDKKYLYGSTEESARLMETLRCTEPRPGLQTPDDRNGVDNIGIELDVAHLPLMGESFEQAFKTAAPYLVRVHIGNCVLKDRTSPWYGDMHPPVGFEGGEIDVPELAHALSIMLEMGYLNRENRGALVLEMQPFPGMTEDETVRDSMERLEKAWEAVS